MIQMIIVQTVSAFGAIMMLIALVKLFFHTHDLILFPAALSFGLFYTAFIERRADLIEGAFLGIIYALSAYGLYMLARKLSKVYRHQKEGPFH
ncbi:hypothetical protein ACFP7A_09250 [Sporolactobacillus kofuensis]|uniref:Uncharacterized protein n=1 Tax=Sporolactobacillus kofuensis TaxID=269672 RepID=A0ABW1WFD9_9BACL|nr:hypothetical protein [Sporolactobacillus kofuensis]MCO7176090.1 hypothetical protein [Sporolactobacillus kofuensis]